MATQGTLAGQIYNGQIAVGPFERRQRMQVTGIL